MKKSMLILACAAITPFAFAQTSTTTTESTTKKPVATETTTTESTTKKPVATESTTTTTTTSSDGTVTTFEPGKTIVIRRVGVTDPISYVLGKTVRFVNRAGATIEAATIKPGARVHVYYDGDGEARVVNRVVVDD
jgi:endonuclease YncB( thermonuclease family)